MGTQVEVIVAIENPTEVTLNYKMTVKSVNVNGYPNMSAASVMLVADYPSIFLLPDVENEIKVSLFELNVRFC